MDETTFKLASIRAGDTVTYREKPTRERCGIVLGWRDVQRDGKWVKQLELDSGSSILLDYVVKRERREGCGQGVIVFESVNA